MKKLFKPAALLFYILSILVFLLLGMIFAGLSGTAEVQGLAGGAIIFFYGIVSAVFVFIVSLFVAYWARHQSVILINKILSALLFCLLVIVTVRFYMRKEDNPAEHKLPTETTSPVNPVN